MKIKDNTKSYFILFIIGILAGVICRLSDLLPYEESIWSFPSIATMFGCWIASVGVITYMSSSNKGAFINSFLYMFGMTISFYGLLYILGFYFPAFHNFGFRTELFLVYSILSVVCAIGSFVLFYWNRDNLFNSVLLAMPTSGMLAETIGCIVMLINHRMLLAQTIFDFSFALWFGVMGFKKAKNKAIYLLTVAATTAFVYFVIYSNYLI